MDELQEDGQLIAGIGAHGKPESIDTDVKVLWSTGDSHLSQFEVIQDAAGVATVSVKSPSPGSDPSLTGGEDMGHPGVQIFKTEMDIATDTELTHQQGSVSEESHILTSDDITEGQMLHVPETEDGAMLSGDPTVPSSIQVATSLASELAANADQDVIQLLLPPDDMCKMTEPGDGQTTSLHTMNISLGSSVITSSPIVAPPTLSAQAITLSDGSTAFIQHPTGKFMEGQTITLEDGTTAVVQGISNKLNLVTSLPNATGLVKTELGGGDSQNTGGVATTQQPVQLEDGATTFLNQAVKDGLQAIILEDGTTAYLATQQSPGFLESPSQLEATATLTLDQLTTSQQVAGVTGGGAVGVAGGVAVSGVSGVQHLLTNGLVNVDVKTLALHGQTVVTNGLDPSQMTAGVKTAIVTTNPSVSDKTASPFVEKAYRCSYDGCGRYYTTLHHLRVHERSHTGDRPFRCEFNGCGKAFATGYGLKSHTRVHTGEKPYKCPDESCDKAFKTSGDLQKHVRTHTGERPFKCPFEGCTRPFTTSNIRKMHKLHYFQGSRERPFKCPFEGCTRSFTTSNIRKVHIRTHTGERPYTCPEEGCGRAFASATNYKNHIRIHTGEKPYVCTVQGCGKRFTEYSSLYKHHVVHTHAKPYTCNRCGKTYRQTSTLAMHKRTAHGEDVTAESEAVLFQEQAAMDTFETVDKRNRFNFSINHDDMQDDGEGTLVINTSDPGQQLTLVGTDSLTAVSADALQAPTLAGQTALLQQAGVATFTLGDQGQQVYVITDPAQLEALQQIAQHQFDTEQLDNSLITSLTAVAGGADTTVLEPGDVTTVTEITSPPNDITDAAVVSINGAGVAELQAFQTDT